MLGKEGHRRKAARRLLVGAGYKAGGSLEHHLSEREDEEADKRMIERAIREHENHEHGGKHTRLKLADGGLAMGDAPMSRPDRGARGSRGAKGKGKAHTNINVIMAPGGGQQQPPERVPVPVPVAGPGGPPGGGAPPMPPPRPPVGPPPGAPPPGLAGGPPPGAGGMPPGGLPMRKDGGRAPMAHLTAGKGSGEGRLQLSRQIERDKEALCAGGRP